MIASNEVYADVSEDSRHHGRASIDDRLSKMIKERESLLNEKTVVDKKLAEIKVKYHQRHMEIRKQNSGNLGRRQWLHERDGFEKDKDVLVSREKAIRKRLGEITPILADKGMTPKSDKYVAIQNELSEIKSMISNLIQMHDNNVLTK